MIFRGSRIIFFCFNDTAATHIYTSSHTLSLHDALPISAAFGPAQAASYAVAAAVTRLASGSRSEEHTSELQSRELISYAVFCLKKIYIFFRFGAPIAASRFFSSLALSSGRRS